MIRKRIILSKSFMFLLLFVVQDGSCFLFSCDCSEVFAGTIVKAISVSSEEESLLQLGEVVFRELKAEREGMQTFEALGRIGASREMINSILSDFTGYPNFMPNVKTVEVVSRTEGQTVMNYALGLPLGKEKRYRLKITDLQTNGAVSVLYWSMVEWPGLKPEETIKDTTGYWLVQEDLPKQSLVLYHVSTDPGEVPFGLGWIVDILSKQSVPQAVSSLRERAMR
ncbi:MAG: hypothetical protein OEM02_11605 [Desulfobulbaceae bacterium]|nr:hypothetical protein [Desulfobulbaceae bacterium]